MYDKSSVFLPLPNEAFPDIDSYKRDSYKRD